MEEKKSFQFGIDYRLRPVGLMPLEEEGNSKCLDGAARRSIESRCHQEL